MGGLSESKRSPVTNSDIQTIIRAEILGADGQANSQLSVERAQNMDYYQARPFGNEIEGRSTVVSTDVRDTVEWILPSIIRIFTSGEDAVEFEPQEANDIAAAKQATEYVNFIWSRDNRGFLNYYSWFKDALISKNGVIKIWWDDTPQEKRERYSGLDDDSFAQLVNDKAVEVSEHTERTEEVQEAEPGEGGIPQQNNKTFHDVVITRKVDGGCVKIVPVPPEEFLISKDARSIADARFVGHRRRRTVSDLIEEGFPRDVVERLSGDETSIQTDAEEIKRNTVEYVVPLSQATVNPAMRQLWVTEGYLKADVDGDGIAEMRKVVVAGATYEVLSNEAWDTPRPFADLTPIIMPHRYHGLCPADLVKDIQLIRSTILRQYLDNLYLANNQRELVIESLIIDPSEVLSSAPGRKIRQKNGPAAVMPIVVPNVGDQALAGLNYIDQVRENRTGVSARTQGLGANQLHDTARGEQMLMSQAMGKIELIARIFAETGVRDAFRLILKLVCMYQPKERVIRLRDEWVPMDPVQWNSDMDMSVTVGMGMGDREQQLQHAMLLGTIQEKVGQLGFVTPENLRNTVELAVNAMGLKGVERFFTFPQGPEAQKPPAPPPNPEMAKVQAQAEADKAKAGMDAQIKAQQGQTDAAIKAQQMQTETQLSQQRMGMEFELKRYQTDQELALKREQLAAELQLKREQMAAELELKRQMGALQAANDTSSDIGQVSVGGEPG